MGEITVRIAVPKDLITLQGFEQALIDAERLFDPTIKPAPVNYYDLKSMMDNPDLLLLVAETDGVLIGSGYCRIDPDKPFLKHGIKAYFGFMYVVPEFRGQGINGRIMTRLKDWARSRGITECRLDVYHGNTGAMKAYEKMGFRPYSLEMRMDLRNEGK
jgi:ribosomal protein S18 acetylase RimI-like enzyme